MEIIARSFEELNSICSSKKRIVVSGPQRSGTTFIARQLSGKDKPYIDEFERPSTNSWVWQFANNSHLTHDTECDLIVWMLRDESEVIASQKRIGWNYFKNEKEKYVRRFGVEAESFSSNYKMKHHFWNEFQKDSLKCDYVVFKYEDAGDCSGFLEKKKREHFKPKQTC